jgi:hypothetical protein
LRFPSCCLTECQSSFTLLTPSKVANDLFFSLIFHIFHKEKDHPSFVLNWAFIFLCFIYLRVKEAGIHSPPLKLSVFKDSIFWSFCLCYSMIFQCQLIFCYLHWRSFYTSPFADWCSPSAKWRLCHKLRQCFSCKANGNWFTHRGPLHDMSPAWRPPAP